MNVNKNIETMENLKAIDLVKNTIYTDNLDKAIPLMFTGKVERVTKQGIAITLAYFTPVRTETNKNWYDSIKVIIKSFDEQFGNYYIKERQ